MAFSYILHVCKENLFKSEVVPVASIKLLMINEGGGVICLCRSLRQFRGLTLYKNKVFRYAQFVFMMF